MGLRRSANTRVVLYAVNAARGRGSDADLYRIAEALTRRRNIKTETRGADPHASPRKARPDDGQQSKEIEDMTSIGTARALKAWATRRANKARKEDYRARALKAWVTMRARKSARQSLPECDTVDAAV